MATAMEQGTFRSIYRSGVQSQKSAGTNRAPVAAGKNIRTAAAASRKSQGAVTSDCHSERSRGISDYFFQVAREAIIRDVSLRST
jgi:hypothetical protein